MLDCFEILTTSGVVLWSRSYAPVAASVINSLINDVFIEEKVLPGASVADDTSAARNPAYRKDQYTLKWATVKDLGLIFVVRISAHIRPLLIQPTLIYESVFQAVYQSLLHISWIDKLIDNIRILFVDQYKDQLKKPNTTLVVCHFDDYFDQQVRELESTTSAPVRLQPEAHSHIQISPGSYSHAGSEDPPPIPGLLRGTFAAISGSRLPD